MKKLLVLLLSTLLFSACVGVNVENGEEAGDSAMDETSEEEIVGGGSMAPFEGEFDLLGQMDGFSPYEGVQFNYEFLYPDYYNLSGYLGEPNNEDSVVRETVSLFHQKYYPLPVEAGGPPNIIVHVLDKPVGVDLVEWSGANENYTNFRETLDYSLGNTARGYNMLTYSMVGMYTFDYYVVEGIEYIYVFGAAYGDNSEETKQDLPGIIESLQIIE